MYADTGRSPGSLSAGRAARDTLNAGRTSPSMPHPPANRAADVQVSLVVNRS
jgi:hypothetical protein